MAASSPIYFRAKLHLMVLLGLLVFAGKAFAIDPLEVGYIFDIDQGDRSETNITIERDGKPYKSRKGDQKKGVFELDYQHEYVLTFSKKGYQTKKIAISTKVPADRLGYDFDPIEIEVELFKQFDNVNLQVFNQPVGRYAYLDAKKDFGYDTDYTTSILTQVKEAENQLKQKRQDENKIIAAGGTPPAQSGGSTAVATDGGKAKRPGEDGDKNSEEIDMGGKKVGKANGSDKPAKQAESDADKRRAQLLAAGQNDREPSRTKPALGEMDTPGLLYSNKLPDGRTEKTYIEGTRQVREITITKEGKTVVFRKVSYVWGIFYFRNGVPITESLFVQQAL